MPQGLIGPESCPTACRDRQNRAGGSWLESENGLNKNGAIAWGRRPEGAASKGLRLTEYG
jgi:hypothetical protein